MRTSQLISRNLAYYWRTNLAVVLGVATATAVLAGALLVGNSVRASLRDLVVQRLGQTSVVVTSSNFFREQLANDLKADTQFSKNGFAEVCPLISLEGSVTHEPSKRVASSIRVYGVDDRFWMFHHHQGSAPQNRNVFVSQTLARELGTNIGDSILLQVVKPSEIPLESLHSKKEDIGKTLRLSVAAVLDAEGLGEFAIQPQQTGARAVFISLPLLQRELEETGKANLILVSSTDPGNTHADLITKLVNQQITLTDLGIQLRTLDRDGRSVISLEHESKVLPNSLAQTSENVADKLNIAHSSYLSYLANNITAGTHSVPYSLVTALSDSDFHKLLESKHQTGTSSAGAELPPIILNDWAATDLEAKTGDVLSMDYYFWQEGGRLETRAAKFQLAGIVPIQGLAADKNLVPDYPGISGSANLSDWDPPFPVDLQRVRPKDEDYWHQFGTTPKAFLPLSVGQSLWQTRFGKVTSLRFLPENISPGDFETQLKQAVDPLLMGVAVVPVRAQGLQASQGATDFGEYFLYFSFFLVISALLLTTLFFKLGIEQRIQELGTLRAMGFGPSKIRTLFVTEALALALAGSLLGLAGAVVYGQLMMLGLRTWWVAAVGTTALKLHVSSLSLAVGAVSAIVASLLCVALTLRGLRKQSTRGLLSGSLTSNISVMTASKTSVGIAVSLTLIGLLLLLAAAFHLIGQVGGFFGSGSLLLIAFLFFQSSWLRRRTQNSLTGVGWWPIAKLGFRNTSYRPSRSILCIALIASATFIVVSVDSFRHRDGQAILDRKSGTGGFPLLAESLQPLIHDPSSHEGREALNLVADNPDAPLNGVALSRFRVQPGDDASCLNLYQPHDPKVIAPTDDFLQSNRFAFQNSIPGSAEETANPWLLLNRDLGDGTVPAIADANSLSYVLHLKLGDELTVQHGDRAVRLRIVAALSDSLFQSELLISEKNFVRLFPDQQGYRFFLIDVPNHDRSPDVAAALEDRLADFGFDVQSTSERMASFHRVENTYLSTFQLLGGLGLALGTIGLAAILLRNVLERRRELALMRAVGYNSRHFTLMIVAENALLLFGGVATGAVCALLAIVPVLLTRQGQLANLSLGFMLLAVLVSGLSASILATWVTLRAPLLAALKSE